VSKVYYVGRRGISKALERQIHARKLIMKLCELGYGKSGARAMIKKEVRKLSKNVLGTVAPSKTGKGKDVFIRRKVKGWKYIRVHEKFHADVPVLGRSEFLAHGVHGAYHVGRGDPFGITRALATLIVGRPGRAAIEAGGAYGAYRAGKHLRKKREES